MITAVTTIAVIIAVKIQIMIINTITVITTIMIIVVITITANNTHNKRKVLTEEHLPFIMRKYEGDHVYRKGVKEH